MSAMVSISSKPPLAPNPGCVGPSLLGGEKEVLIAQDRQRRLRRGVAGRGRADPLEQVADKIPEVRLELLPGLPVRLGNVNRYPPAELLRLGRIASPGTRLAE